MKIELIITYKFPSWFQPLQAEPDANAATLHSAVVGHHF